jgi:hypothetical protein
MPIQFTPFVDKFKESVCGVEATITITIEQTACIPPFIQEQFYLLFENGGIFTSENGDQILYQQQ